MTTTVARQEPGLPVGPIVVAVIVLAAGVVGWLEPRLFVDPLAVIEPLVKRLQVARTMTRLPEPRGDIMAVQSGPDGSVWVAGKYRVVRYAAGDPDQGRRLLDPEADAGASHRGMGPLSSMHVASGETWVGTQRGQLLRFRAGGWVRIAARESAPGGAINAIVEAEGAIYAGADGVWMWSAGDDALKRVEGFPRQPVTALARGADGGLLAATPTALLARRGGDWHILWRAGTSDVEVTALFVTRAGELLLGTHDGYLVFDAAGQELVRELGGMRVTGFSELPDGALWVATGRSGIHMNTRGQWRRLGHAQGLPGDAIVAIAADARRRVWIGIQGDGVSVGEAVDLAGYGVDEGARRPVVGVTVFPDACAAAASVLGSGGESGGVAVDTVAGRTAVFFNGRQVCPSGAGYRGDADTLVSVDDSTVRYRRSERERLLPLPARAVGAVASAAFVDSAGGLWLGFLDRGVFVFKEGYWRTFSKVAELAGNPVQAIAEDASGAIWIATRPPFDGATGSYRHASVHRYDGRRWKHFRSGHTGAARPAGGASYGLPGALANSVRVLSDGRVAIATNGGLAVYDDGLMHDYARSAPRGLASKFIADVVEGPQGRLWLTHAQWGHGVSWKSGFLFHNRSTRDGLLHERIDHLAFDAKGNIWMQSSHGETAIYPLDSLLD